MLFQLDDLNISCHSFRLLYSIIRRAYYDKCIECTISTLCDYTGLTKYKVKEGIKELKEQKLIQVIQSGYELEITLLPKVIKMITLDFKRRGGSGKAKAIGEIKKSSSSSKKATAMKTTNKSTSETLTPTSRRTGSPNSLNDTTKKIVTKKSETKPKPQLKLKPQNQEMSLPATLESPRETTVTTVNKSLKGLNKEYISTRGELYKYFEFWLKTSEAIANVYELTLDFLDNKWKQFKEYSVMWLKLQKHASEPCKDLNRVKFMKKIAAQYLAETA